MTDLDVYGNPAAQLGQYQAGIIMTPESARALDEQVRRCTEAVLQENTDYGIIPGTNGQKTLWRPGAQKLLQWFGLGFTCERVEVERDDDGRKHGITYRAVVARRLPDGTLDIKATCEGTADYDESKFYQPAEEVQRKAEYNERKWAKQYSRPADPTKWKNRGEYRADWNALMKRAQKRAIVGAVVDATAAGGIFSDREEDDHAPPPDDTPAPQQRRDPAAKQQDGDTLFQQLLTEAASLKTDAAAARVTSQAKTAAKKNEITLEQEGRIQDRIQRTLARLHETAEPVDTEDLARQAAGQITTDEAAGSPEDQPGTVSPAQLTKLHTVFTGLGFNGEDREQKLVIAEVITDRAPLTGPEEGRSSKNLSLAEARKLIDTLDGFEDRDALIAFMADHEQAGDDDA